MRCCTVTRYILLFASFKPGENEVTITFVDEKLEWREAVEYCLRHDSVLESNETVIENELSIKNKSVDVWIGKYEAWAPWFAIFGCYEVQSGETHNVGRLEFFVCQKLCSNVDYFSIKDGQCVCIQNIHLLNRVNYKSCNCCNCFEIMTHNFVVSDNKQTVSSETKWCMAAQCSGKDYLLTRETCNNDYAVICDNGILFGSKWQSQAANDCKKNGSFIRWYPESICKNGQHKFYLKQHWTSATQSKNIYVSDIRDEIQKLNLITCMKRHKDKQSQVEFVDCDKSNNFICRYDTSKGNRQWTSFSSCKTYDGSSSNNGVNSGTVAGSVVAIVIIIILIIVGICVYRKRENILVRKPKGTPSSTAPDRQITAIVETAEYTEITDDQLQNESRKNGYSVAVPIHNTEGIKLAMQPTYTQIYADEINCEDTKILENNDKSSGKGHKSNDRLQTEDQLLYEFEKGPSDRQHLNSETNEIIVEKSQYSKSNAVNVLQNTNYFLAQPVCDSAEIDPYNDNQDYDKLNSVKKRDGDNRCKVYDHLHTTRETGQTYHHTVPHSPKVFDNNYNENPKFETNTMHDEKSLQKANYSLAKPIDEIDPYSDNRDYDKLNSVKKKDDNTQCKVYDHLPTTQETDPTYDHTVMKSPKSNDNNYDHFSFDNIENVTATTF